MWQRGRPTIHQGGTCLTAASATHRRVRGGGGGGGAGHPWGWAGGGLRAQTCVSSSLKFPHWHWHTEWRLFQLTTMVPILSQDAAKVEGSNPATTSPSASRCMGETECGVRTGEGKTPPTCTGSQQGKFAVAPKLHFERCLACCNVFPPLAHGQPPPISRQPPRWPLFPPRATLHRSS